MTAKKKLIHMRVLCAVGGARCRLPSARAPSLTGVEAQGPATPCSLLLPSL